MGPGPSGTNGGAARRLTMRAIAAGSALALPAPLGCGSAYKRLSLGATVGSGLGTGGATTEGDWSLQFFSQWLGNFAAFFPSQQKLRFLYALLPSLARALQHPQLSLLPARKPSTAASPGPGPGPGRRPGHPVPWPSPRRDRRCHPPHWSWGEACGGQRSWSWEKLAAASRSWSWGEAGDATWVGNVTCVKLKNSEIFPNSWLA
jgi:hypothetical protein